MQVEHIRFDPGVEKHTWLSTSRNFFFEKVTSPFSKVLVFRYMPTCTPLQRGLAACKRNLGDSKGAIAAGIGTHWLP